MATFQMNFSLLDCFALPGYTSPLRSPLLEIALLMDEWACLAGLTLIGTVLNSLLYRNSNLSVELPSSKSCDSRDHAG
jgi:hypothetical protein